MSPPHPTASAPTGNYLGLARVPLPGVAGERLARDFPDHGVYRATNPTLGLGIVLPMLATAWPFSLTPLAVATRLVRQEMERGRHLLVLRKGQPTAYVGWTMVTEEQATRFLGEEGTRATTPEVPGADRMAFLAWISLSRVDSTVTNLAVRSLYAGARYCARRANRVAGRAEARVTPHFGVIRAPAGSRTRDGRMAGL